MPAFDAGKVERQLRSEVHAERRAGTLALVEAGPAALPVLRRLAVQDTDPELRSRLPAIAALIYSEHVLEAELRRPFLGIQAANVPGAAMVIAGGQVVQQPVDAEPGVLIGLVISYLPADRAGLRAGDRILSVNGTALVQPSPWGMFTQTIAQSRPGDAFELVVRRGKEELQLSARLGVRPVWLVEQDRLPDTLTPAFAQWYRETVDPLMGEGELLAASASSRVAQVGFGGLGDAGLAGTAGNPGPAAGGYPGVLTVHAFQNHMTLLLPAGQIMQRNLPASITGQNADEEE